MITSTSSPITGAAMVGGIAGQPVTHSLSPVIHNAWIAATGLDAAYVPFGPRDAAGFDALVAAGRAGLLMGINVTAPFKERAFALADETSEAARLVASANVLVFEDGRVRADSTDGMGLMIALEQQAPDLNVHGQAVAILGAGGAARAAAGALAKAGAAVRIVNRSRDRAEALAADVGPSVIVASAPEAFDEAVLVVNALSVQPEFDLTLLSPATVVMDMTYKPLITPLLAAARARGLTIVDGLGMLIGQAGPSFEAIFRTPAPDLDVRSRILERLGEAG